MATAQAIRGEVSEFLAREHGLMIGGEEVSVTGLTEDGNRTPVLVGGAWQI